MKGRSLPTTRSLIPSKLSNEARLRQLQRTFYNLKLTILCGFITILVLRGTIGAGEFGTPAQDFHELRNHIQWVNIHRKHPNRVLAEVKEERQKPIEDIKVYEAEAGIQSKSYSLGSKILDWDEKRRQWLNKQPNFVDKKPNILLVTGSPPTACENPAGDHFLLKSIKNKIDYCRLHDIEIFYSFAHLDSEMTGYWSKLPLLRKLMLSHPEIEWFWWMDSDAMFTDMVFQLPIDKYKDHNLILHGWDDAVYNKKNWIGLNTGSFLIRNCQWSLDILDAWAPMGPKGKVREDAGRLLSKTLAGRPEFEADDQSALVHLLTTEREKWGNKVFLENSYYLHGYWVILVENYEKMIENNHPGLGDERWPFVTHFVGCKPCGNFGDYPVERCLKQMERAFNFADNQVMQMYGYKHTSLETASLKIIRNDKDNHLEQKKNLLFNLQ